MRRQSAHMADYAAVLAQLEGRGLVYRCFRTRREVMADIPAAPHGPAEAIRPGPLPEAAQAAALAAGRPFAWRLWLARCAEVLGPRWDTLGFEADGVWVKADPARLGDAILGRKEFPASYHLASVHDDAMQGITHVKRGEDLREAAHLHVLLQALMGWRTPIYRHHQLVLGPDGKRLAKRDKAEALASLRARGVSAAALRAELGFPPAPGAG